jgi:dTDP-4-amino-4,6-dideoxygalactose transaminase
MKKNNLISISISPNLTDKDVLTALKYLFVPYYWFKWKKGDFEYKLKQQFEDFGFKKDIYLFNSARSGFYCLLKALDIKKNDEIIVQPCTCMVVPNIIKSFGAKPVYVDINIQDFNIDPKKIEQKITTKTKAIIVQHTFGIPAKMDEIIDIAKNSKLYLIEDCAVALGASYNGIMVGNFGDAAFYSFGRDKVISSVTGGAVIINNRAMIHEFEKGYENIFAMSNWSIFQCLMHIIISPVILRFYNSLSFGKFLMYFLQKIHLLNKAYTKKEFNLQSACNMPRKYANCLAEIAVNQFKNLNFFNAKRNKISQEYKIKLNKINFLMEKLGMIKNENNVELSDKQQKIVCPAYNTEKCKPIFLRYPVLVNNPHVFLQRAKKKNIMLGDWYKQVIMPINIDYNKLDYIDGSCPKAELAAKYCLNLPTYYRLNLYDINRIIKIFLKEKFSDFYDNKNN